VRFGPAAGMWTRDHDRVLHVSDQLNFGKVGFGDAEQRLQALPPGQRHVGVAIEEYTRSKHVMSSVAER
jgi:acyl-CoA reductase-like NAD-dependent aldehyde dehydrogenase